MDPQDLPPVLGGTRVRLLARLVANSLAQAGAAVGAALLVRLAFDRLITTSHPASGSLVVWVALGLAGAAAMTAWLRMLERTDAERVGQDYVHQVRMALFDRLSSLAPRALQRRSRGGVMLRFVGDLTALRQWISLGLARLTVAVLTTVSALAALTLLNPVIAAAVAGVLTLGTIVALGRGERLLAAVREARRRQSYLAANVNEKIGSMAVVQVFGQSRRERRRVARQGRRLRNAMVMRARIAGQLRALTEATTAVAHATALLVGALEVGAGRATAGTVVAAMTIVGLLLAPLRDLGRTQEYWHGARASREKLRQFLEMPTLVKQLPGAPALKRGPGRLVFEEASLPGSLERVSAVAEPGTVTVIVGPNGAGKSSLLALAARLTDPSHGCVRLDGQDLAAHSLASVRRAVGMVSADLPLLRGTLEKNLRYRWRAAPPEELQRVIALCGVDSIVAELPEGLRTRLTEGGANLSVGQRQRIALARALLGNPAVLLLDEADSNLDPQASAVLDQVLTHYRGTVLMVSHRLDRLSAADTVWHLAAGRLLEQGPTSKVLASHGPTARLFDYRRAAC